MQNQKENYFQIYKEDTGDEAGIMQDIYIMSEVIKFENNVLEWKRGSMKSLDASGTFKVLGTGKLLNFTD